MTIKDPPKEAFSDRDENEEKKSTTTENLKYPKSVFFIVSNEFCERFSYYGMRTILILFLTDIVQYSEEGAKIVYHVSTMLAYFFPLIGAIISDSWLGKFKTIFYLSIIYAAGNILLTLTAVDQLHMPQKTFTLISLLLIAFGTGGIKPCVSAFGGDQFVLPQQARELVKFFSLLYFFINSGSLISTFLTPILRNNVHCLGKNSCYPLAFAIPGILMVISIVIFVLGRPLYKIRKPQGNVMVNVVKCITYAITHKKVGHSDNHWLDKSEPKFGAKLVSDVKALLKVLVIYIPLPIFSALYDQQGSAWIFQAVRMNGDIGFYTILPDQMQVVNPVLILAFIPLFSYAVYPLLAKCNLLKTPLQRMCCGGFLAAAAFGVSACVSIALENTYPVLPSSGEAQLRMYDTTNCNYSFQSTDKAISSGAFENRYYVNKDIQIPEGIKKISMAFFPSNQSCSSIHIDEFEMNDKSAYGIFLDKSETFHVDKNFYTDNIEKSEDGYPLVRTLISDNTASITYTYVKNNEKLEISAGDTDLKSMPYVGKYNIDILDGEEFEFKLGGTYTVIINMDTKAFETITVTEPNSVHILWQLPPTFIMTVAEILFSITGLEFSYSQAPASMKSVLQAAFLLTTAFGNLIIVVIESVQTFDKQSNLFFLYTGLMVADMLIFMWLAIRYKYIKAEESSFAEETESSKNLK